MSKQIKASPMNRKTDASIGARDVLLAGIGAVSLLRKNATLSLYDALTVIERLPEGATLFADGVGARAQAFRNGLTERATSLNARVRDVVSEGTASVEARLQPLLRKFNDATIGLGIVVSRPKGKRAAPAKRTHKTATKSAKRSTKKVA